MDGTANVLIFDEDGGCYHADIDIQNIHYEVPMKLNDFNKLIENSNDKWVFFLLIEKE